jgi:hypothetical protein
MSMNLQVKISGSGDWSVWDFSGQESYFVSYDLFLGSSQCVHLVLFDASQPEAGCYRQINFWLSFLRARLPIRKPWGTGGKCIKAAPVVLVGTHLDAISSSGTSSSFRHHHGHADRDRVASAEENGSLRKHEQANSSPGKYVIVLIVGYVTI